MTDVREDLLLSAVHWKERAKEAERERDFARDELTYVRSDRNALATDLAACRMGVLRLTALLLAATFVSPYGPGGWRYALLLMTEAGPHAPAFFRSLAELAPTFGRATMALPDFWAFLALLHLVFHALVFLQRAEALRLDPAVVSEQIRAAVIRLDEAETLRFIEPLHGACRHFDFTPVDAGTRPRRANDAMLLGTAGSR